MIIHLYHLFEGGINCLAHILLGVIAFLLRFPRVDTGLVLVGTDHTMLGDGGTPFGIWFKYPWLLV